MDKAYSVEEIRKTHAKAYAPWTKEEDEMLKKGYDEFQAVRYGRAIEEFIEIHARKFGRKPGAIRSRIEKLLSGAIPPYKPQKNVPLQNKTQPNHGSSPRQNNLDLNPEFKKAYHLMEKTNKNVFLTGRAGTGKSTLLTHFRNNTKKKVVILAPTGVAALNVKGQTIHSFFKFKPDITTQAVKREYKKDDYRNIYKKIDTIVIDEISMVRADLLDCVDKSLRLNRDNPLPFGGVQMIFIGDLYQLPPVVTGSEREIFRTHYKSQYFFDAKVFEQLELEFIELEKVYRQKDDTFISLLNAIRNNSATEEHPAAINKRHDPHFSADPRDFSLHLTTTNALADTINFSQLGKLATKEYVYNAHVTGSFDKRAFPTEIELSVKVGSQVMMMNNDSGGRWVNGTIGKIIGIEKEEDGDNIVVELADGSVEEVAPHTWELFQFGYDPRSNSLISDTVGTFTQYPLRLAWAVTIHKAQGKTFDQVIIDIGTGTFVHGQLYVALSRCTTLAGITLKQPVQKKHIFMDWRVVKFVTRFQYQKSEESLPIEEKVRILKDAVVNSQKIPIVYLKANDEKSKRIIHPLRVGEMEYQGKNFLGVKAFDEKRGDERVFKIERILSLENPEV